ncbi:helix-turn-helix transcriptional regulator [Natronincola ferrireducens]|uniref:DNA-binding transcriptional regulator, XRE-family HTH domain n=1 Tax=Natronincola ferrireducens TaxID=393762 RepID=A0A1G9I7I2_9FIRM|nr:helix-turn-helix domain-containing protein [Natronincola ferrireducens]SDL21227.1 DNA-binding transcriptional regulator, XRE-family HTH domain [Natronincola ferrireducens]
MEVKNKLKEIRMKEYMLNQKEFAELLEINYRQYNKYENEVVPSLQIALHIAKKLNKPLEEIFYLE